mmetsp:Transcript_45528/g.40813  ORF Transcript_45528/g.40813 Transcript_45528/m.40813 type:complete len:154 (-) Transcript_45528:35-496(-)
MAAESQLTELLNAEGQTDNVDVIPIAIVSSEIAVAQPDGYMVDNGKNNEEGINIVYDEGQLAICVISDCNQVSIHQCSICNENICTDHCRIKRNNDEPFYECNNCISNRIIQERRNMNRNIAKCCIKRLIIRLCVFFILVIIASIYASSSHNV